MSTATVDSFIGWYIYRCTVTRVSIHSSILMSGTWSLINLNSNEF